MAAFTELMNSLSPTNEATFSVAIPESWMQGRTTYGGLSAALCLEAVLRTFSNLPPLRSAQITFVGPAGDIVKLRPRILRQGKSVSFIEVAMEGERGPATRATFCFGESRESRLRHSFVKPPSLPAPDASPTYLPDGAGPNFIQHYEHRLAAGARPLAGSKQNDHYVWARHKDNAATGVLALLALADMLPPAILPLLTEMPPVSSMSWMLNFLTPEPATEDGWWLLRSTAENAGDGYSSQNMSAWNHRGEAVITARQNVAVFY